MKQVKLLAAVLALLSTLFALPAMADSPTDSLLQFFAGAEGLPQGEVISRSEPLPNFDGFYVPRNHNYGCASVAILVGKNGLGYTILRGSWQQLGEPETCTDIHSCVAIIQDPTRAGFTADHDYRPALNQSFRIWRRDLLRPNGDHIVQVLVDQPNSYEWGACRQEFFPGRTNGT
jgi:hypothetical protein